MSDTAAALAGRSFGSAAGEYARARPEYPAAAIGWLLDGAGPQVADVGAGTGKLTAGVLATGRTVTAVDPDAAMLAALAVRLPSVPTVVGVAEALPLPDASADAMLFGQAWHWVDLAAASREAARVLRPHGVLGLVWNLRDESVDWVEQLGSVMHGSAAEQMIEADAVQVGPEFESLERDTWSWTRPMSPVDVVSLAASRSYSIALPERERAGVFDRIRHLLASHPQTAGRGVLQMPYRTEAYRTRRRPTRPHAPRPDLAAGAS